MKIREIINSNAEMYSAVVYEDNKKIVVVKHDTFNYYDRSTDERIEFDTITKYREWLSVQDWIVPKKIKKVGQFKSIAE